MADHRWSVGHMSEHLDDALDSGGRERVERHLHDCPKCRELLRSLRATVMGLARFGRGRNGSPEGSIAPTVIAHMHEELGRDPDDGRHG